MKKFFTLTVGLLLGSLFANGLMAQNEVYWREGFETGVVAEGTAVNTVSPASGAAAVPYWANLATGSWYIYGAYRTTGTACATINGTPAGPNHIRLSSKIVLTANSDSAYIVTPVVNFGVQELHFTRTRASKRLAIFWRADTSSAAATGWNLAAQIPSSPTVCLDTTITIAQPTAQRVMIRNWNLLSTGLGTDDDIDSIWLTSSVHIVPVKFNVINANFSNGLVKVLWTNETEVNTANYQIERSIDGRNFVSLGAISANNQRQYVWFDYSPAAVNYYRIKGIDQDGKFTYSTAVKVSARKVGKDVTVMPNPVKGGKLNLQFAEFDKGNYNVTLYSNNGQKVYSTNIISEAGTSSKSVALPSAIANGLYKLQVEGTNTTITKSVYVE